MDKIRQRPARRAWRGRSAWCSLAAHLVKLFAPCPRTKHAIPPPYWRGLPVVILFLVLCAGGFGVRRCGAEEPAIRVSDVTLFGDMECFKIETPGATYLYGKIGAGFASILDRDGHDWISYRPGGKSAGEYHGLPKCGQPVKYFHCGYGFGQYATDNPFTSTVTVREPVHVRIHSVTKQGDAEGDWDFFPAHATFTLRKIPGEHYWFLYEGTPGGALDVEEDFVVRAGGQRTPLKEPWKEVVPWVAFGAKQTPYRFLLLNHQPDSPVDSYVSWPYTASPDEPLNQMTVFGFGRPDWQDPKQHTPPMTGLPARLSIGFTTATDAAELAKVAESMRAAAGPR
jgi:hypothetical protein